MPHDISASAKELSEDFNKITDWGFLWKINFNTDHSKQAYEVLLRKNCYKQSHLSLFFNNKAVSQKNSEKHFRVGLDSKLTFHDYLGMVFTKVKEKLNSPSRKLNIILPTADEATIFKVFFRP